MYPSVMADQDRRYAWLAALKTVLRWNPESYRQVWLILAIPLGLVCLAVFFALGRPLLGLVLGGIITLMHGTIQSHRLDKRRDASTPAEWASARHLPPPGP